MATFAYIARDQAGKRIEGQLAGASAQAVLVELQSRHLAPVSVQEMREPRSSGRRVPMRRLAGAYRQLADLLRAGVPLLRGLRLLARSKADERLAAVMTAVADAVADGSRLADAMAAHRDVFPDVQVAMVRAGERGGFLEPVLRRMGDFLEHQADIRARVVGSLIYPAALIAFGLGVVTFALVAFVPRFRDFYSRIEVPWPTQMLLGASDLITNYGLIVGIVLAALGAGAWRALRRPDLRRKMTVLRSRVPKLGPLLNSLAVGRFTRILGTLLENGIPMLAAIQISRDAAGNVLLAEAIDKAGEAVRSGEPLAKPLAESGMFPDDVLEMISVGESANNLPQVLITIAETIEKRVDRMLNVLLRLLEPLLLLMLAGAILFIFIALIVPMMRMSSSLSG